MYTVLKPCLDTWHNTNLMDKCAWTEYPRVSSSSQHDPRTSQKMVAVSFPIAVISKKACRVFLSHISSC